MNTLDHTVQATSGSAACGHQVDPVRHRHHLPRGDGHLLGADDALYATMTGNQKDSIVRINPSGLTTTVVDNAIGGQMRQHELDPKIAIDGSGNFYILANFASQVFKFDRTGKFVDSLGGRGDEPGQFSAVNASRLTRRDACMLSDNKGVQVFTPDGRYLDVFDIPKSVASGMAFDDDEHLWIAAREQVYELSIDREYMADDIFYHIGFGVPTWARTRRGSPCSRATPTAPNISRKIQRA